MGERVSGTAEGRAAEEFARLLRELKDRSGLSYGALAKRLHMSTSTLHRYGQGGSVPSDYAPVERLARVCRATPQELVELHRRWVLADEERRLRADHAVAARPGTAGRGDAPAQPAAAEEPAQEAGSAGSAATADVPPTADTGSARDAARSATSPGQGGEEETDEPVVVHVPRGPASKRRSRTALTASAAAAAVLVTAVLVARPLWGGGGSEDRGLQVAGGVASSGTTRAGEPSTAAASSPASPSPASASASGSASRSSSPAASGPAAGPTRSSGHLPAPLTVGVRPYVYDDPCKQFLVDKGPEDVGTAPEEEDAPQWVARYGAVATNEQRVALTVQGTGSDTVVLEALHVDVVGKGAPLAWNDYAMTGCGGNVETKSFDVDLDSGRPVVTLRNGQRAFPYKVSESDPEVFYVTARTAAHDVRWRLSLDWSSGGRHGTVVVDDDGTAFRTSADLDRPRYECPPGGDWVKITE